MTTMSRSFRVVGINQEPTTRKVANWICKHYPALNEGEGKRPEVCIKHKPYCEGNRVVDPMAVKVYLVRDGKYFPLGWISKKDESGIRPNKLLVKLIDKKAILEVKLEKCGSFVPEDESTVKFYAAIIVKAKLG